MKINPVITKNKKIMTFGIIGNTKSKDIHVVLNDLLKFLVKSNFDFIVDKDLDVLLKNSSFKKYIRSGNFLLKKSDLIISIGGDGTFLNTARIVGRKNTPILGVNLGSLGFMAEVTPDEINDFIYDIIKRKYKIHKLCIISAKYKNKKIFHSLNDIFIDKFNSVRMIDIDIFYNDEKVVRFVGDGVIVSTPTGSTGYSLSAGGSIISPYSKVFIITPICPHSLNVRPIIVPDDGKIRIHVHGQREFRLTSDGYLTNVYKSPADFTVVKADYYINLVKRLNKTYFQTLNNKLLWGEDKRKYSKSKDYS
jgi:NAD+ kinase